MNIDTKQAFELGYQQGYANGKFDGDEMGYRVGREQALQEVIEVANSLREGEDNETILREMEIQ